MVSSFNSPYDEEIVKLKHPNIKNTIKNRRILRSYQHTTKGAPRIIYLTPSYSSHISHGGRLSQADLRAGSSANYRTKL